MAGWAVFQRDKSPFADGTTRSTVWTSLPDSGTEPEGVTIDLAPRIGEIAGLPVILVKLASSAEVVATTEDGTWNLSVVPIDATRWSRSGRPLMSARAAISCAPTARSAMQPTSTARA
jgi:hypothetical protein